MTHKGISAIEIFMKVNSSLESETPTQREHGSRVGLWEEVKLNLPTYFQRLLINRFLPVTRSV